jgi:hypothetical protein
VQLVIYDEQLIEDIRRLPGGQHTFLSQVCSREGTAIRAALERLVAVVGEPVAERCVELLRAFDNRRFFQGYAELAAARLASLGGLRIVGLENPGPMLIAESVDGERLVLSVLSFIHRSHPVPDRAGLARLMSALDRLPGNEGLLLVIHRLPPGELDTESIRRAVEVWLGKLRNGEWPSPWAVYDDKDIHLEFSVTGNRRSAGHRVSARIGPFWSPATISAVETRVLAELEAWRLLARGGRRLALAVVADQPWSVTPGYARDFLLGRPLSMLLRRDRESCHLDLEYGRHGPPSVFRDPLYQDLAAFVWIGRDLYDPRCVQAQTFLNPWGRHSVDPSFFQHVPLLAPLRREGDSTVLRWLRPSEKRLQLVD